MNIFALDESPIVSARCQHDKHVVKMVLETAQILSTVMRSRGYDEGFYKPTHQHHPSVVWAGASEANLRWTLTHAMALCSEYTHRFHRHHASETAINAALDIVYPTEALCKDHTPFAMAMPDEYKTDSPVESYRRYYIGEKLSQSGYRRDVETLPQWLQEALNRRLS